MLVIFNIFTAAVNGSICDLTSLQLDLRVVQFLLYLHKGDRHIGPKTLWHQNILALVLKCPDTSDTSHDIPLLKSKVVTWRSL